MAPTVERRNEFKQNSNDCFGDIDHGGYVHLDDMIRNIVDQLIDSSTICSIIIMTTNKQPEEVEHE